MKKSSLVLGVVTVMLVLTGMVSAQSQGEVCKGLVRMYYEEAFSKGKPELLDQIFSPTVTNWDSYNSQPDLASMKAGIPLNRASFPDVTIKIVSEHVDGDTSISEFVSTSTFTGVPMSGYPATGKAFPKNEGTSIARCQGGKVVEMRSYWNFFAFMQALGAITLQAPPKK